MRPTILQLITPWSKATKWERIGSIQDSKRLRSSWSRRFFSKEWTLAHVTVGRGLQKQDRGGWVDANIRKQDRKYLKRNA